MVTLIFETLRIFNKNVMKFTILYLFFLRVYYFLKEFLKIFHIKPEYLPSKEYRFRRYSYISSFINNDAQATKSYVLDLIANVPCFEWKRSGVYFQHVDCFGIHRINPSGET